MKNKFVVTALSFLLFISVLAIGFTIDRASGASASLYMPSVNKNPSDNGTDFTVPIMINVTDLYGFDINITWDNNLINFQTLDNTPLNVIWPQGFFEPLPLPGYQASSGSVRYAAVPQGGSGFTGSGTLFSLTFKVIKTCNFPLSTVIHFVSIKLSDSNLNAITPILTDGTYNMTATVPGLEFAVYNPNPSKPFEYGKVFDVGIYATNYVDLTNYNLTILYDSEFLNFTGLDTWGILGTGTCSNTTGSLNIWISSAGPSFGAMGQLFNLTFKIQFDDRISHIWRINATQILNASVSFQNAQLGFLEGTLFTNGIAMPPALGISVHLIRGDVNCDGQVDIFDLVAVAQNYDKTSSDPQWPTIQKYDIYPDGTIDIYDLVGVAGNFNYGS